MNTAVYTLARDYYNASVWQPGLPAWENATQATRNECYAIAQEALNA